MAKDEKAKEPRRKAEPRLEKTQKKQSDSLEYTQELSRQHEFLATLTATSPVGITHVDASGRITYANAKAEKVLRLSKSKIENRTYNDPQWRITDFKGNEFPVEKLPFNLVKESLKPVFDVRHAIKHKDGSLTFLSVNASPLLDRNQKFIGMAATIEDITLQTDQAEELQQKTREIEHMNEELRSRNKEQSELLEKVKESRETYRNLFQNAQVGLFRTRISDGKILESNEQLARMFGYDRRDEFVSEYRTTGNYVDKGTRGKMLREIKKNGSIGNFEARFYRKDRSVFWARYSARIYPNKGWIEGVCEDITESKQAEISLQREKEWSESIIDNAPNIIVGLGEKSRIRVFNHYAEKLTGYAAGEVIGKEWIKLFTPREQRDALFRVWDDIVTNKLVDHQFENEILTRSGERRLIEWSNTILTEEGEFRMILSLGADITERRQARELLRRSEKKFKSVFDFSNVGKSITLPTGEINVNKAFCDMLGYSAEELRNKKWQDITPADEIEATQKQIDPLLKGEVDSTRFEKKYIHKNGSIVWGDVSVSMFRDEEGEPLHFLTTVVDITERMRAEQALSESEAGLREAQRLANIGNWRFDLQTGEVSMSKEMFNIIGLEKSDAASRLETHEKFYTPASWQRFVSAVEKARKSGESYEIELEIIRAEGTNRYAVARGEAITDPSGKVITLRGTLQDITERKKVEDELREQKVLLSAIYGNAPLVLMVVDSERRIQQINGFATQIAGGDAEEMLGLRGGEALRCLHSLDDPRGCGFGEHCQQCMIRNTVLHTLETGETHIQVEAPFSLQTHENEVEEMTYLASTTPIMVKDQRMALVTLLDISKRKQAEDELRESEKQYAFLTETAFDLVELTSIQNIYEYTARKLHELTQGMGIVGIVEYDTDINLWKMKHIEGVDEKYMELSKIFGFDIRKMEGEISTRYYEKILSGKLEEVEFDLPGLFNNRISEKIGITVKKMLSIGKMYCIAFQENERILGNITLVMKKNARPLNSKLVESFVLQVSNFVKKQKSEEALKSSEIKFRTLVDQASEMLFLHDLNGNLVEINQAAIQSTGYSRGELEKMNVLDIDPDAQDRDDMHTHWLAIKPDDPAVTIEGRHKRKDGSIYPAEITLSKIAYSGAQYILGLARDITERKEAENALLKMKDNLEIQVREKTRELQERVAELERFHDATIEREFRIKELRTEIERLSAEKK